MKDPGMTEEETSNTRKADSKVARMIDKYNLGDLGSELEDRWLAEDGDSLRDLATMFNKRVLGAALESTSFRGGYDLETLYRRLTDETVPAGERREAERLLNRAEIDVESLKNDFVSHQSIHTYLRTYRQASYPEPESEDRISSVQRAVNRLQSRLTAVVESNLDRLRNAGDVTVGSIDIFVTVEVYCQECGISRPFGEFLEHQGCACSG